MHHRPLLLSLFLLLCGLSQGTANNPSAGRGELGIGSGNQFHEYCASVEKYSTGNDPAENLKGSFCLGYVEGFLHGVLVVDRNHTDKTFCLPSPEVTNLQVVRIIRKFIPEHPERAHQLTAILAVDALRGAFPCRNTG